MNDKMLKIECNEQMTRDVYRMVLCGDFESRAVAGQFVNLKLDGLYLRRPISVCDYEDGMLTIIYKCVGTGTEKMSTMKAGDQIQTLYWLGNGYNTEKSGEFPLLIGGGVGIPPMYYLCRKFKDEGKKPSVILGFNKKEEIFLYDEFKKLGCDVYVSTVDGSFGTAGFVTDVMKNFDYTYFYTCGPMPMFKAINNVANTGGQFSFEERMGCGFGACMGCTCKTVTGYKRICKDGPVLEREEILWDNL